jgi:hypothetical protein
MNPEEKSTSTSSSRSVLLWLVAIGFFMQTLDGTIVNTALPTMAEALGESPALLEPREGIRLTCWVGGAERAEFLRQNALLANIWTGLGARTAAVAEPDRHHFNVIDGLADPDHPLSRTLLGD